MKVSELIERLQRLSPDLDVLVEGYETGFDAIHCLKVCPVERNAAVEDWDGEFEESPDGVQEALLILGRRGHRRD
jgi:hypothetical protein